MAEGIVSLLTLLLKLVVNIFVKTPEEKETAKIRDRLKNRMKRTVEVHDASKAFKDGNTVKLERVINDVIRNL